MHCSRTHCQGRTAQGYQDNDCLHHGRVVCIDLCIDYLDYRLPRACNCREINGAECGRVDAVAVSARRRCCRDHLVSCAQRACKALPRLSPAPCNSISSRLAGSLSISTDSLHSSIFKARRAAVFRVPGTLRRSPNSTSTPQELSSCFTDFR